MGSPRHFSIWLAPGGHSAVASIRPGVLGADRYAILRSISSTAAKPAPAATPSISQSHTSRRRILPGAASARTARGASLHSSSATPATTMVAAGVFALTPAAATSRRDSRPTAPAHGIEAAKTPEISRHETDLVRAIQNQANTTHMVPSHAPRLMRSVSLTIRATRITGKDAHTTTAWIRRSTTRARQDRRRAPRRSHHSRSAFRGEPAGSPAPARSAGPGPPAPGPPYPPAPEFPPTPGTGTTPYPPAPGYPLASGTGTTPYPPGALTRGGAPAGRAAPGGGTTRGAPAGAAESGAPGGGVGSGGSGRTAARGAPGAPGALDRGAGPGAPAGGTTRGAPAGGTTRGAPAPAGGTTRGAPAGGAESGALGRNAGRGAPAGGTTRGAPAGGAGRGAPAGGIEPGRLSGGAGLEAVGPDGGPCDAAP